MSNLDFEKIEEKWDNIINEMGGILLANAVGKVSSDDKVDRKSREFIYHYILGKVSADDKKKTDKKTIDACDRITKSVDEYIRLMGNKLDGNSLEQKRRNVLKKVEKRYNSEKEIWTSVMKNYSNLPEILERIKNIDKYEKEFVNYRRFPVMVEAAPQLMEHFARKAFPDKTPGLTAAQPPVNSKSTPNVAAKPIETKTETKENIQAKIAKFEQMGAKANQPSVTTPKSPKAEQPKTESPKGTPKQVTSVAKGTQGLADKYNDQQATGVATGANKPITLQADATKAQRKFVAPRLEPKNDESLSSKPPAVPAPKTSDPRPRTPKR